MATPGSLPHPSKVFTYSEVAKHNTADDIWVIFHDVVYDLTKFIKEHPGGQRVLLKVAGKDGTKDFSAIHPTSFLTTVLPPEAALGSVDPTSTPVAEHQIMTTAEKPPPQKPLLRQMLNVFDFEAVASQSLSNEAWGYYSSGAADEITLRENHSAFHRIWFRPRVLVDVSNIDTSSKILGYDTAFPLYITATAMGRLGHPDGELAFTRACHKAGIVQMCPTLGSCSLQEMIEARAEGQIQFFQLYVNRDREKTKSLVQQAAAGGCKALCITVDAPCLGAREKDMRNKFDFDEPALQTDENLKRDEGVARGISQFIDPSLAWKDIAWFQSITDMPIVLKGIQCGQDAVLAALHGCQGVILSNHGGRQLDGARSGIELLTETMDALQEAGLKDKIEVWIDGGIRRGTDIFKAIALGAKAVGIGRPALYGLSSYGQAGVERVLHILKTELEMCMRLMGTPSIKDIKREMVITKNISDHISVPKDFLANQTYIPLQAQYSKL